MKRTEFDWKKLERDVVERIRMLAAVMSAPLEPSLKEQLWQTMIQPAVYLLADFVMRVQVETDSTICDGCGTPAERCTWQQGKKCCPDCTHGGDESAG